MLKLNKIIFISNLIFIFSVFPENNYQNKNLDLENSALNNIKQLTFTSMGFEKAGESYFSPDSKKIIFQAVPTGKKHYQIYVLDLENNSTKMVSTGYGACTCAYFRPDGKKIIFASSHEDPNLNELNLNVPGYKKENSNYTWDFTPYMNIYEANPDGSNLLALTKGPAYHAECAYSCDGSQIVFASNLDGHMNLYTMDSNGSNINQITYDKNSYNGGPFFSPNNDKIIYRADYDKKHYLQIYSINIDGTQRYQVTKNDSVNWAPYWYSNGNVIAFTTSIHGHHKYEIYLLNIKTNIQYRITYNGNFNGLPSFNKDGSKLIWTSKRSNENSCQIFMADFVLPEILK